jgi:hypothetical protein
MGDKPKSFINSSEWIGAFECSLCMNYFLGIDCRIINLSNGSELYSAQTITTLQEHFKREGTPVMIGGHVKAFTIVGIDV